MDDASTDTLPARELGPGEFFVFHASDSPSPDSGKTPTATPHPRIGNGLGNDGDHLLLIDPTGKVVDAVSWGADTYAFAPAADDVPAGHSIERREPGLDTDSAVDWVDNDSPSPGRAPDSGGAKPQPKVDAALGVSVIPGQPGRSHAWIIWSIVAFLAATAVGAVAWQFGPAAWQRVRARRP
jgi:hypothetical protein